MRRTTALATAALALVATTITVGGAEPERPDVELAPAQSIERTHEPAHERETPPPVPSPPEVLSEPHATTEPLDDLDAVELAPPQVIERDDTTGTTDGDEPPDGDGHEPHEHERHDDTPTTDGAAGAQLVDEPWASLADCESGDWIDGGSSFVAGSARWRWAAPGEPVPSWGTTIHHGGLQFHPDTWTWLASDVLDDPPTYAYDATPSQQVAVAIETQRRQGWGAWPVCSRKVGLR